MVEGEGDRRTSATESTALETKQLQVRTSESSERAEVADFLTRESPTWAIFVLLVRDRDVVVEENEFVIVPKGMEHCPVAEEEAHVLLFEPKTTLNTGNVVNERTREKLDRI